MSSSGSIYTTLCHPDSEKTCFFCCPPLRPHGYNPLERRSALKPVLRQNRKRFLSSEQMSSELTPKPINGWECWGLGYLDENENKIGCLLHPFQHNGTDYRYLVEYEGKCAREMCLEAKCFEALTDKAKRFYLDLSIGMDSFEYSSRERNPIFRALSWGWVVSEKIAENVGFRAMHTDVFKERYKALLTTLSYKTDGYFVERAVVALGVTCAIKPGFLEHYRRWHETLVRQYCIDDTPSRPNSVERPVHLYSVPLSFSRFLKFGLNIWNASEEGIAALKEEIDREIERFLESLHVSGD